MNNYEGNKKGFNRNGGNNKKGGKTFNKPDRDAINAKRAEIIEKQTKSVNMLDAVSEFLDNTLKSDVDPNGKITMQKVIDYLTSSKGYTQDETKIISQFNYLIVDLANAQKMSYISGNRINIRILYIQERLKSSFKKELHDAIDGIIGTYNTLFYWNPVDENNSEEAGIEIVVNDVAPVEE